MRISAVVLLALAAVSGCSSVPPVTGDAVRAAIVAQTENPAGAPSGAAVTDPSVVTNAVEGLRKERVARDKVAEGVTIRVGGASNAR